MRSLFKLTIVFILAMSLPLIRLAQGQEKQLDPKAWGGNHVGKPIPEYVQGDECLFCHRNNIGPSWQKDPHSLVIREREAAPELDALIKSQSSLGKTADEVTHFLGSRHRVRFLKKEGYGKFSLLNLQAVFNSDRKFEKWIDVEKPAWEKIKFAERCAGCHATAVDPANKTFSGFSLDCYTCHGDVNLQHTNDTSLILLAKKNKTPARVVTSICAQCHLREGKSRSTGLPYPNTFIAGDNLFQDFAADFAKADDEKLNAGDRHIWRNVRDVVVNGDESITCLSCHQVHANSSFRHRRVLRAPICAECHQGEGFKNVKRYAVQSSLCEY